MIYNPQLISSPTIFFGKIKVLLKIVFDVFLHWLPEKDMFHSLLKESHVAELCQVCRAAALGWHNPIGDRFFVELFICYQLYCNVCVCLIK